MKSVGNHNVSGNSIQVSDKSKSKSSIKTPPISTEETVLKAARGKIKSFMKDRKLDLRCIFDLIDTDASKGISLEELEDKNELLDIGLTRSELELLFEHIDVNHDTTITYQELVVEFKKENCKRLVD
jgi:Ca2+-binding EF-hand superfamily protein